jgi:diguanylate cyclase (GGDEF)-like protein
VEFEDLLRGRVDGGTVVLYRPETPEEVPFDDSPTVEPISLDDEFSPSDEPDLNALLYRENGLVNENHRLYHLKADQQWYASIEGPEELLTELESSREQFLQVFKVLYEQIVEKQYTHPGRWIPDVRDRAETHAEQDEFFASLIEFVRENLSVDEVGLYVPSNKHYTLEAYHGFDPEERIPRKFFPRDQLRPMEIEGQSYRLEFDDGTGLENLFIPLNVGPQRQGLLVFFGYLPEGENLDGPDQLLVETLQHLLSLVLAAHRSAFGRKAGYIVDELTSLQTEKYFRKRLKQETERGERYGTELALFILEIENLENIKENYGENAEREALRKLAHLIKSSFRLVDVACRFENDQFGIIYPNTPIEGARTAAQRFDQLVENPFLTVGDTEIPIMIDGGLASFPEDGESPDEMIKQARLALYEARQSDEPRLVSSHEIDEKNSRST